MPFPVLGSNSAVAGYEIDNSLRFNDHPYLEKTFGSAGNRKTFTISFWTKRSVLGSVDEEHIFSADSDTFIRFENNDRFRFASNTSPNVNPIIETNRVFRDVSAWMHFVLRVDTTQASSSNRVRLYVNGTEETSFATDSRSSVSQNADMDITNNTQHTVGTRSASVTDSPYTGYLADFYLIDGQSLAPTEFGETNDNGVWIPKEYEGTYGTNGFFLEFQDSGNLGDDTSGNTNDFTATNLTATDQTTDTPTNNFCTLNPLVPHNSIFADETEGNTVLSSSGVQVSGGYMGATIMPTSGKWYFEVKIVSITNSTDRTGIAIPRFDSVTGDNHIEGGDYAGLTVSTGTVGRVFVTEGSSTTETNNNDYVFSDDDIAIFAVDMDASTPRVYVGKNGTWFTTSAGSGGNPASDTGYFEVNLSTGGSGFSVGAKHNAGTSASQSYLYNFGNPAFSISSGNSDANGYGNFEYAVPSGYYALCTKNLAEYG